MRFFLFRFPAEFSHRLALTGLNLLYRLGLSPLLAARVEARPLELFGLRFAHPVGLAAGLDKNGDYIDALGALGFGFIEVGTVTPRPQPGNPKPRLFRLTGDEAIINRMGFNNKGVDHLVRRLRQRRYRGIVGVNIGKNRSTPAGEAVTDYLSCLRSVYEYADYVTVNLSSPNTPGLRELQFGAQLEGLLAALGRERQELERRHDRHVPLLVKISPDLSREEIDAIARAVLTHGIEGVIATNTTVDRSSLRASRHAAQSGGLSGRPLGAASTDVIRQLATALAGKVPVIGVGGIMDADGAREKVEAGASLLQVYTGFIYRGPALIAAAAEGASTAT